MGRPSEEYIEALNQYKIGDIGHVKNDPNIKKVLHGAMVEVIHIPYDKEGNELTYKPLDKNGNPTGKEPINGGWFLVRLLRTVSNRFEAGEIIASYPQDLEKADDSEAVKWRKKTVKTSS